MSPPRWPVNIDLSHVQAFGDIAMMPYHEPCKIGYGHVREDMTITCETRRSFKRIGTTKDEHKRGVYAHTDKPGCGAVSELDPYTGQRSMRK